MNRQEEAASKASIFDAIKRAKPTVSLSAEAIQKEASALLLESKDARPSLLHDDAAEALMMRVKSGLVIGTSCENIATLADLPESISRFLKKYDLGDEVKVQETPLLKSIDWKTIDTNADIENDNTVGVCLAEYGIAETGSFVVHSSNEMPILLNFLPFYVVSVLPRSKILHYMDDYALIANDIAKKEETPRNMCLISGASGTTDIEGVLVQGAHGPEFSHIVIVDDL